MRTIQLIFALLVTSVSVFAQKHNDSYLKDVESIDAIITAYYDIISGAHDDAYQFDRDEYIHVKDVRITRINEDGIVNTHPLEAEYIPFAFSPKIDMY